MGPMPNDGEAWPQLDHELATRARRKQGERWRRCCLKGGGRAGGGGTVGADGHHDAVDAWLVAARAHGRGSLPFAAVPVGRSLWIQEQATACSSPWAGAGLGAPIAATLWIPPKTSSHLLWRVCRCRGLALGPCGQPQPPRHDSRRRFGTAGERRCAPMSEEPIPWIAWVYAFIDGSRDPWREHGCVHGPSDTTLPNHASRPREPASASPGNCGVPSGPGWGETAGHPGLVPISHEVTHVGLARRGRAMTWGVVRVGIECPVGAIEGDARIPCRHVHHRHASPPVLRIHAILECARVEGAGKRWFDRGGGV